MKRRPERYYPPRPGPPAPFVPKDLWVTVAAVRALEAVRGGPVGGPAAVAAELAGLLPVQPDPGRGYYYIDTGGLRFVLVKRPGGRRLALVNVVPAPEAPP